MPRIIVSLFLSMIAAACGVKPLSQTASVALEVPEKKGFRWQDHIVFSSVPSTDWQEQDWGSPYYRDIMRHTRQPIIRPHYSAMTNAHESNHRLNAESRNQTIANDNVVYFEKGMVAYIAEPKLAITAVRNFVPTFIKKSRRYQHYVISQSQHWPNILYLWDEWSAYRTDLRVASEIKDVGKLQSAARGEVCVSDGAIEFMYFASAAVAALQQHEPQYLQNVSFKSSYLMLAEQSLYYFRKHQSDQVFNCQAGMVLQHFLTSPDNQAIRNALVNWLGKELYTATFEQP